jgi:hypothetical protein
MNELERIWKEKVVAWLKVLSRNLSGGTEKNHENPVRVAGLRAEIWTRDHPTTKDDPKGKTGLVNLETLSVRGIPR